MGVWVIAMYERERFLGIVEHINMEYEQAKVRCLEKPFSINIPQALEKESKSVYCHKDNLYEAPTIPDIIEKNRKCLYHYSFFSFIFLQAIIPTYFLFCMRNCQHIVLSVSKFFL